MKTEYLSLFAFPLFFIFLFIWEQVQPLRKRTHTLSKRLVINLILTGIVFVVGGLIVRNVGIGTSEWASTRGLGLVFLFPGPQWSRVLIGFLLLDLTFYYWHLANHRLPLLWRFHNVHHIDPDLDVSTSFRFHFVEIAYSSFFRFFQVLVIGAAPLTYVVYETVFTGGTMLHHSNIKLPLKLEYYLNKAIVTPRMHGVHHSAVKDETNSNYSVVFSWWDRLHKTLVLNVPQSAINIGVPGYQLEQDNRLFKLIGMPFVSQREYWKKPDGSSPSSNRRQNLGENKMLE
jgi:sterol desaturase/sphingolipid hydroxylase (fatty acid hydroxylase superfamily)